MYRLLFAAVVTLTLVGSAFAQTPTAADADFNGNGEVDIPDFLQFVDAYGSQTGDANYDAKFDLDGNGVIGIPDFLIFVDLYGQTVPQVNDPPIADAGEYQSVDKRDMITLNGANSRDPEGQPLTFAWRQVEGPPITLPDATIARPTFRIDKAGHYTFELVVSDGVATSLPDTAVVDVVTISEDAVFAGGDDAAFTYKAMTGNQMVFTAEAGAPQVQVGEVMVNTVEPYFLKKVTRVVSQSTGEVVVETEDAALTDVVEEASIRQTFRFPAATKMALATDLIDLPTGCMTIYEDEEKKTGELFSLCATATNIALPIPEITAKADITKKEGIEFFVFTAKVTIMADCAIDMTVSKAVNKKKELKLLESEHNGLKHLRKLRDIVIKFGSKVAVPAGFQVEPDLVLGVEAEIRAKGELKADLAIDRTIEVGIKYNKEDGFFDPVELEGEGLDIDIITISLSGEAKLQAYARGKIDAYLGQKIGGNEITVGGGAFSLGPYAQLDAKIKTPPIPPTIDWSASMGIGGKVELYGPKATIKIGWWKSPELKVLLFEKPFIWFHRLLKSGSIEYGQETPTIITDANLRAVIADRLGKASGEAITSAEMAALTHLDALNKGIRDLTGLEQATNLTWLELGGVYVNGEYFNSNAISDFSPVSGLTSLTRLDLDNNSITNISPLSGLTNLTWLDLGGNSISDISVLSGLTRLDTLGLSYNSISDISVLSGLTRLELLFLGGNSISDISVLSGLTLLERLFIGGNSISNLAPLVANTGLGYDDEVDVRNNPLSATSINTHIPALRARGVRVYFGASKPAVGEDAMPRPRAATKMFGADAGERYGSIYRRRGADKDR